uniref:Uncharacterized protein TCIL3000_11_14000 n=1 Tax=Trypanosoma congolense (strain IL3000) TaxID=1068625 RepID=G0V2M2_TRYCI|nr:unnamed protein product [Trypanosoma congolense IL3000]
MESIFCVEQVNVPPELGTIMKQYTKAILRDRPIDLYKYSANFFAALCGQPAPFDKDGHFVGEGEQGITDRLSSVRQCGIENAQMVTATGTTAQEALQNILDVYDVNGDGRVHCESLPALLEDIRGALQLGNTEPISVEQLLSILHVDDNGTVDLLEFRQLFFEATQQ